MCIRDRLEKQLKVRVRTLPIIKNKESALRMEVKRCKADAAAVSYTHLIA